MTDPGLELTPREITRRLDEYIVGQTKAKRAVAVVRRNRCLRRQLPADVAADVYPKNILLIGPTGVGKTEIARRLASLARAPFVKVEATKYSEVGYHGRDVESMVRDLVDASVALVRAEKVKEVESRAREHAEERIYRSLVEQAGLGEQRDPTGSFPQLMEGGMWRARPFQHGAGDAAAAPDAVAQEREVARARLRSELREGRLEQQQLEIEVRDTR